MIDRKLVQIFLEKWYFIALPRMKGRKTSYSVAYFVLKDPKNLLQSGVHIE